MIKLFFSNGNGQIVFPLNVFHIHVNGIKKMCSHLEVFLCIVLVMFFLHRALTVIGFKVKSKSKILHGINSLTYPMLRLEHKDD